MIRPEKRNTDNNKYKEIIDLIKNKEEIKKRRDRERKRIKYYEEKLKRIKEKRQKLNSTFEFDEHGNPIIKFNSQIVVPPNSPVCSSSQDDK